VYQSEISSDLRRRSSDPQNRGGGMRGVSRNVWFLGLTSLLTDLSSEMVTAVLPIYALYFLHMSPSAFGIVDGLQQGGASLVKLASGVLTDRTGRYKTVAGSGYGASALSRLGLLAAGPTAGWLTPLVALDRIGKGIRTAPRDAIISLSVSRRSLAAAFGVHRTLDTVGAVLGPLLGFVILRRIRDGYDVVFVVSLALAAVGLAVLVTFVRTPTGVASDAARSSLSGIWTPSFARVAASAAILGAATVSDSFIYLSLQRTLGFDAELLPLLYTATPAIYLTLATPFGKIADRVGSARVIGVGYTAMLLLYGTLSSSWPATVVGVATVVLLGMFYAATDGVFAALASAELPAETRATGLATVSTLNDAGKMIASFGFGWLWSTGQPAAGVIEKFQIVLLAALAIAAVLLWPLLKRRPAHDHA
jgi:MFS family permease